MRCALSLPKGTEMRVALCFMTAALMAATAGCGDGPTAPAQPKTVLTDNPLVTSRDSLVDRAVRAYVAKETTAGLSLALIDGDTVRCYNYGETRRGNGVLPDVNTIYEIGSITKTFTSAALLVWLQERGVALDTPVEVALPPVAAIGLQRDGVKATFRQLLNHTSGLPRVPDDLGRQPGYRADDPYAGYDSTRILAYLASHAPVYTPGTPPTASTIVQAYSNLAYGLAGVILERNRHASLESIFAATICGPLGMTATTLAIPSAHGATPHDARGRVVPYWDFAGFAGAGALHSTLHDMALYARAQLGAAGGPLQPVFASCHVPTVTIDGRDVFGLGWEYYYLPNGRRLTVKDGGTGGSTSFLAFDPATGRALVMLCNNAPEGGAFACLVALFAGWF